MQNISFHDNVQLAVTDKSDGNIDLRFSSKNEVRANRKKILKTLDIQATNLIEGQQIHGTRILPLNEENSKMWKGMNVTGVDGFVTDQDSIALMLRVADCAALVYYDPTHTAIGVFHAGWRGIAQGIQLEGVRQMMKHYETDPRELMVWISPCAQKASYAFDTEPTQAKDPAWKEFISKSKGKWHIDLPGYVFASLNGEGVLKKNMSTSGVCTIDSPDYYSHTQSKNDNADEGRCAVIVKIIKTIAEPKKIIGENDLEFEED
jgi:YfiH family protein